MKLYATFFLYFDPHSQIFIAFIVHLLITGRKHITKIG